MKCYPDTASHNTITPQYFAHRTWVPIVRHPLSLVCLLSVLLITHYLHLGPMIRFTVPLGPLLGHRSRCWPDHMLLIAILWVNGPFMGCLCALLSKENIFPSSSPGEHRVLGVGSRLSPGLRGWGVINPGGDPSAPCLPDL